MRDVRQLNTTGQLKFIGGLCLCLCSALASRCVPLFSPTLVVLVGVHTGRAWPEECKQGGMAALLPVARLLVLP